MQGWMLLRSALIAWQALARSEANLAGDLEQAPRKTMCLLQACVFPGRTVRVPHFPCREGSDRFLPLLNENDAASASARADRSLPHRVFPCIPELPRAVSSSR